MNVSDPGPFIKLWWKGVDMVAAIIANLASAAIIAPLAWRFWERKKKERELSMERDSARIIETEVRQRAAAETSRKDTQALLDEVRYLKERAGADPGYQIVGRVNARVPKLESRNTPATREFVRWWKADARFPDVPSAVENFEPEKVRALCEMLEKLETDVRD